MLLAYGGLQVILQVTRMCSATFTNSHWWRPLYKNQLSLTRPRPESDSESDSIRSSRSSDDDTDSEPENVSGSDYSQSFKPSKVEKDLELEKAILKEATRKVREKEKKLNKKMKQLKKKKTHSEERSSSSGIKGKAHVRSRKHVEKNARILCKKEKPPKWKTLDLVSERLMNLAAGRKRKSPQSMMAKVHGKTFSCNLQHAKSTIVGVMKKLVFIYTPAFKVMLWQC